MFVVVVFSVNLLSFCHIEFSCINVSSCDSVHNVETVIGFS